ncbi:hypothetical protein ABZS29_25330 [Kribbella sp. NPDC005582]|uniref:hypothetical protein n=1 Tax=Kribbella sp. NPDC005582 TaxID=3156893 RepID=UPI0033BA2145
MTSDEPAPEPTDPESTQTKQNQPAISLATAPIGGNPDEAGVKQCTAVAWLAGQIPEGTTVTLGTVTLEPDNVFKLNQQVCSSDRPQCTGVVWKPDSTETCYVGAEQVAAGDKDVQVVIAADVRCATEQDCRDVRAAAEKQGTQVFFIPGELPSETPETPTGG